MTFQPGVISRPPKQGDRLLIIDGVTKTIKQWSQDYNGNPSVVLICQRMGKLNWSPKKAVTTKALSYGQSTVNRVNSNSPWRLGFTTPLSRRGLSPDFNKEPKEK